MEVLNYFFSKSSEVMTCKAKIMLASLNLFYRANTSYYLKFLRKNTSCIISSRSFPFSCLVWCFSVAGSLFSQTLSSPWRWDHLFHPLISQWQAVSSWCNHWSLGRGINSVIYCKLGIKYLYSCLYLWDTQLNINQICPITRWTWASSLIGF